MKLFPSYSIRLLQRPVFFCQNRNRGQVQDRSKRKSAEKKKAIGNFLVTVNQFLIALTIPSCTEVLLQDKKADNIRIAMRRLFVRKFELIVVPFSLLSATIRSLADWA
jgi:hypothetical protein